MTLDSSASIRPRKVKVQVTESDIAGATGGFSNCPIARALTREFGRPVQVSAFGYGFLNDIDSKDFKFSLQAKIWLLIHGDRPKHARPFKFTVTVMPWLLR